MTTYEVKARNEITDIKSMIMMEIMEILSNVFPLILNLLHISEFRLLVAPIVSVKSRGNIFAVGSVGFSFSLK